MQQACKVMCGFHPFASIRHFKTIPVAQHVVVRQNVLNMLVMRAKHD